MFFFFVVCVERERERDEYPLPLRMVRRVVGGGGGGGGGKGCVGLMWSWDGVVEGCVCGKGALRPLLSFYYGYLGHKCLLTYARGKIGS